MEFDEIIKIRKSVRSFKPDSIPTEVIDKIIEAGRLAPSAQNKQCWRFLLVKDSKIKKELALKSGFIGIINFFLKEAPLIIVACANPKNSVTLNDQQYYLVDTAIAFQQMMLTAWNYGVGSCWLAAFNEIKVKKILNIPDHIKVVGVSPFGYPKEKESVYGKTVKLFAGSKTRLSKEQIVAYDNWNFDNP